MKRLLGVYSIAAMLIIFCSVNSNAQNFHGGNNGFHHNIGNHTNNGYYGGRHNGFNHKYNNSGGYINGYNNYNSYAYNHHCSTPRHFRRW